MQPRNLAVTSFAIWVLVCALPNCVAAQHGDLGQQALRAAAAAQVGTQADQPQMRKYVSQQANFVLYLPAGWIAEEGTQPGFRTLSVRDPSGMSEAVMFYGASPTGNDVVALARRLLRPAGRQFDRLELRDALVSRQQDRLVFDGVYTDRKRGKREFRAWISIRKGSFTYSRIEAPEGRLAGVRQQLLTILANVRLIKGAFTGSAAARVPLVTRRLRDGSASIRVPRDWQHQELGAGAFVATDPSGASSFIVASVEVLSPQLGVAVPGTLVSPYLAPHRALQFITAQQGLAGNMRFVDVNRRPDIAQQVSRVYTLGPVEVEEFLYTFTAQGRRSKGYTFGISFGSRLGVNWRFWHMTVGAPRDKFDALVPQFVTMMQSYKINDEFAMRYIAQGMTRLRQLQQQTAQLAARNAQEIHAMMQAAYDERQRSQDYIDYQRTNYIRGEQDWISKMEGGTIYHTDAWGTKNTETGEYWEGKAYDYVHFKGDNPKYREQMTPIDSRRLWERHIE